MGSSISALKQYRRSAKSYRNSYRNRSNAIQRAYNNRTAMDWYQVDLRYRASDCVASLSDGIQGISALKNKCSSIMDAAEKECISRDETYSEAMGCLQREISRCDSKVDNYNQQISSYEQQIREQGGHIYPWE